MTRIWFPLYVNDFLSSASVAMMELEEIGAYTLLLCRAWQDPKCSLPTGTEELQKLSGYQGEMKRIKTCFFVKRGRLYNRRLLQEWHKAKNNQKKASESASMRWHSERNAKAMLDRCSSPSPSPSPSEEEKIKKETLLRAPSARKLAALPDEQWLNSLRGDLLYQGIDIALQYQKAGIWCRAHKRKLTRLFFEGTWLVKSLGDKPMQTNGHGDGCKAMVIKEGYASPRACEKPVHVLTLNEPRSAVPLCEECYARFRKNNKV